jgi:hypothetical protein
MKVFSYIDLIIEIDEVAARRWPVKREGKEQQ